MKTKKIKITKEMFISIICFIYLIVVIFFIFMDGIGKKGASGVSGFIEQDNLRKSLGEWYQLVFYTFQVNIYFLIIGISYYFLHKSNTIKNLFFCSTSLLLLCIFAILVFDFKSFKNNSYEATKTLFVHFLIPTSAFVMLWIIRKEFIIKWNIIFINSLYITIYLLITVILYYSKKFSFDSSMPNQNLWIYRFLDYNKQIMFIPLPGMFLSILGIIILLLISPFIGIAIFLFIKFVFVIKIQKTHYYFLNKIMEWKIE